MDIIYVSCLTEKEKFFSLFKDYDNLPGQQGQKFHTLTVDGFVRNNCKVHTVTSLPVTTSNCDIKFLKSSKSCSGDIEYNYLPIVNFPFVKNLVVMVSSFFKTLSLIRKNKISGVVCDILNISVSTGARLAAKLTRTEAVGIVTDVPFFLGGKHETLSIKINTRLMNSFDSYVFLTDAMKDVVNAENKKYTVVEGLVDVNTVRLENTLENKYEKKVCMYAGLLRKIYGVENMVKGFINADIPDTELHIYGDGPYAKELKALTQKHTNVKYFGTVPNDVIVKEELRATLLINPRPTNEEYTKYSFPSKNMEYMASGTPVLTTNLPGMPEEYKDYVYIIDDESADGIKKSLECLLSMPCEELHNMGIKAKEFVLSKKNSKMQVKKILEMIKSV